MNYEPLLKRLATLVLSCDGLTRLIRGFDDILTKENDAIGRSDINELEAITQHKLFFGAKLEESVEEIRKSINSITLNLGKKLPEGDELQLTPLIKFLKADAIAAGNDGDQAIAALEKATETLRLSRAEIFPKIESNAYMVARLLQYHRETYAFWQSVAQDSEATYSKSGKTLTSGQRSILSVRT